MRSIRLKLITKTIAWIEFKTKNLKLKNKLESTELKKINLRFT